MPKIESYQPNQVSTQVTREPTLNLNTNANTFGAGIAQGVSNLTSVIDQTRHKIEVSKAEEALVKFEQDRNKLFFDPDSGYFNTEGINAFEGATSTNKELQKLKETHAKGLGSETARAAFSKSADAHITRAGAQIMRHASRGQKVYEQSVLSARIENASENVALHYNDKEEVQLYINVGRDAIIDRADLAGLSPEATNEQLQSFESEAATAIIESAISFSSGEGKNALKEYGKALEGNLGRKLKARLDAKIKAESEQSLSSQAVVHAGGIIANTQNRSEMIEQVNKIKNGDLRKKVMREATFQFNQMKQAESEERIELFDNISKFKTDGGSIESYISSDPVGWNTLSDKQQTSLIKGDEDNPDTWLAYTNLMSQDGTAIKAMSNDEIENTMAVLPKSLRDNFAKKVIDSRNGTTDSSISSSIANSNKIAVEKVFGVGVLSNRVGNKNIDNKMRANQFLRFVNDEYLFRKSQKGSDLSSIEYDDLLNDVTVKAVTGTSFFGFANNEQDLSELTSDETNQNAELLRSLNFEVNTESLFEMVSITKALTKQNKPVTLKNIQFMLGK